MRLCGTIHVWQSSMARGAGREPTAGALVAPAGDRVVKVASAAEEPGGQVGREEAALVEPADSPVAKAVSAVAAPVAREVARAEEPGAQAVVAQAEPVDGLAKVALAAAAQEGRGEPVGQEARAERAAVPVDGRGEGASAAAAQVALVGRRDARAV